MTCFIDDGVCVCLCARACGGLFFKPAMFADAVLVIMLCMSSESQIRALEKVDVHYLYTTVCCLQLYVF